MAFDMPYRPLTGVLPTQIQPKDLTQEIARVDQAEIRAKASVRESLADFEAGMDMRQKVAAERLRTNLERQLPADATSLDVEMLDRYNKEIGGDLPMTVGPKGRPQVDLQALRNFFSLQAINAAMADPEKSPAQALLLKQLSERNQLSEAIGPDGRVRSDAELAAILAKSTSVTTPEHRDLVARLHKLDERLENLHKVRGILSGDQKAVGPMYGRLSLWNQIFAAFGSNRHIARADDQAEIRRFIANDVRALVGDMKGAMNQQEVKLLFDGVPKLTDSVKVWSDYLEQVEKAIARGRANLESGIAHSYDPGWWEENIERPQAEEAATQAHRAASDWNPQKVDLSLADRVPPAIAGYSNSALLKGQLGFSQTYGKHVIYFPESERYLDPNKGSDEFFTWYRAAQRALMRGEIPPPPPSSREVAPRPTQTPRARVPSSLTPVLGPM